MGSIQIVLLYDTLANANGDAAAVIAITHDCSIQRECCHRQLVAQRFKHVKTV